MWVNAPDVEAKLPRIASVINRAEVRRKLLQYGKDMRPWHLFTRVGGQWLAECEALVERWIRNTVEGLPIRGK
jgi:hypothetical protein